jgi:hypothetical protein
MRRREFIAGLGSTVALVIRCGVPPLKYHIPGCVVAMVFAFASIAGASGRAAMEHAQKSTPTDSRDHNSARSTPPDTTPYVRPVIPADRESTPLPPQRTGVTPSPASDVPGDARKTQ